MLSRGVLAPLRAAVYTRVYAGWALLMAAVVLGGCARPAAPALPVEPPPAFSQVGTAALPGAWWSVFGDARLDVAVDTALAQNFDIRAAYARLRAAQAIVDREAGALYPSLDASLRARRLVPEDGTAPDNREDLDLEFVVAYEADLWGRIRAGVAAERFRAEATRADVQAAMLSLAAAVVRTWAQLGEAEAQRALVLAQIETNETVLQLLENRLGIGLVEGVDLLRQRQLLEATREQLAAVIARRGVLRHQLALLLGRPPQDALPQEDAALPDTLPVLPPLPDPGVPLDLVQRRPDIRRAWLDLRAADRDLAVAVAEQYPRLTLSASAATRAAAIEDLFQDWVGTVAGNLFAPIFFGGELRAEVDRAEAVRQQRAYEYGQATLVAFGEVEDALVRETQQRVQIARIAAQIDYAQRAYEQLRLRYLNGEVGYLEPLTALTEVQQLRRALLAARLTLVDFRIGLYRALAGPIDPRTRDAAPVN